MQIESCFLKRVDWLLGRDKKTQLPPTSLSDFRINASPSQVFYWSGGVLGWADFGDVIWACGNGVKEDSSMIKWLVLLSMMGSLGYWALHEKSKKVSQIDGVRLPWTIGEMMRSPS